MSEPLPPDGYDGDGLEPDGSPLGAKCRCGLPRADRRGIWWCRVCDQPLPEPPKE